MSPNQTNSREHEGDDSLVPFDQMAPMPADSDQMYLRMLEADISHCTDSKMKLGLLIEFCDVGISILEDYRDAYAEMLRRDFGKTLKTPAITSRFDAEVSHEGMSYLIEIPADEYRKSRFGSAPADHSLDIQVALDVAYDGLCAPLIELKNRIRIRLKVYNVMTTYDAIGQLTERLLEISSIPEEERLKLMRTVPGRIVEEMPVIREIPALIEDSTRTTPMNDLAMERIVPSPEPEKKAEKSVGLLEKVRKIRNDLMQKDEDDGSTKIPEERL